MTTQCTFFLKFPLQRISIALPTVHLHTALSLSKINYTLLSQLSRGNLGFSVLLKDTLASITAILNHLGSFSGQPALESHMGSAIGPMLINCLKEKTRERVGTWNRNLLIHSQTPYPLGRMQTLYQPQDFKGVLNVVTCCVFCEDTKLILEAVWLHANSMERCYLTWIPSEARELMQRDDQGKNLLPYHPYPCASWMCFINMYRQVKGDQLEVK